MYFSSYHLRIYNSPSDYLVRLNSTCEDASDTLNDFSSNFNTLIGRSELTQSHEALDLLAEGIRSSKETSVFTITDSNSEGYIGVDKNSDDYVPNKIKATIAKARSKSDKLDFFAVGVNTLRSRGPSLFLLELSILAENISDHQVMTEDYNAANAIVDLLEDNLFLCPDQG